ncbi:MAG: CAP domain-containing protein [Clostridiales bacterium]|nr:CAP domain-containing protein [Clostridiales bacterium]
MTRRIAALLCALLLVLTGLPLTAHAASKKLTLNIGVDTYQNRARSALKLINHARKKKGLNELTMLADLEKAAIQRAAEASVHFAHQRPDLTDFDTAAAEYASLKGATAQMECLAAGYSKAEDAVTDWDKAILDQEFTHVGIACVSVKDSAQGYYWVCYLQQQPDDVKAKKADAAAKANQSKSVTITLSSGLFSKADRDHKGFQLKVSDINMKTRTTVQPTVYLYDQKEVKIGKLALDGLTCQSSNTAVFTVLKSGTIRKKKAGTATLTVKAPGLTAATCTVTVGSAAAGATAATIKDMVPTLKAREYKDHVNLTVSVKGASGYVLYRSAAKGGSYTKVDEKSTTGSCTFRVETGGYYKVRAYKNSNGKRMYSQYSDSVRVQ